MSNRIPPENQGSPLADATGSDDLSNLIEIAERAWTRPRMGGDPLTAHDLVSSLTALACNRLDRIRELESHIINLCQLHKPR